MTVMVGTSGWQYRSWRAPFYQGAPQGEWLERYAQAFSTVEVNNAFYRLPEQRTFEQWAQRTPDDFVVAVKASRYLTHIKRLRDPEEPVARLLDRIAGLGPKLGPVLLQLPPTLQIDVDRLDRALRCFPPSIRVAVELRHPSWFVDDVCWLLEDRGAALCMADSPKRTTPTWKTTDWGYVRFHEGVATPKPCYGRRALRTWAERVHGLYGSEEVYAFFNNDTNVCAVRDAGAFADEVERCGGVVTRAPRPRAITVG